MFNTSDTIAAISTAAGAGGRAIVRLSGPDALEIAGRVFASADCEVGHLAGFRVADGLVRIGGRWPIELPARAYVFRAPRSYTRQDICELHIPGTPQGAAALLESLLAGGARQAQAGEFTARAFYSGRIDLSAAEAVADIIHAADEAQLRWGLAALGGRTFRHCQAAGAQIADALALIEASIDLADEDIHLDAPSAVAARLELTAGRLRSFVDQAGDLPEISVVPRVVLVGRPNVGKSSLLNALCGQQRAIVCDMPGTTRDVLSATMRLDGVDVLLQDAAGIGQTADALQQASEAAARAAVAAADDLVLVVDATADELEADLDLLGQVGRLRSIAPLVVLNKCDLLDGGQVGRVLNRWAGLAAGGPGAGEALAVSARAGSGLEELKGQLGRRLTSTASRSGQALGLHLRQKRCLLAGAGFAQEAATLLAGAGGLADVAELAAIELRSALAQLGQISGQVVTEDILGRIFRRFCVGK